MRASLTSSLAVTCAAALALPVSSAAPAAAGVTGQPPAVSAPPPSPDMPGSTQSLPLSPPGPSSRAGGGSGEQGVVRRDVRPFSLVGVVWDDPSVPLRGTVQVRTRATGGGAWSEWQDVETHNDEHGADPGTREGAARGLRGSTAPLWVGDSDGVELRVRAEADGTGRAAPLPDGLRLELVDPGEDPEPETRSALATEADTEPVVFPGEEETPGTPGTGTGVEASRPGGASVEPGAVRPGVRTAEVPADGTARKTPGNATAPLAPEGPGSPVAARVSTVPEAPPPPVSVPSAPAVGTVPARPSLLPAPALPSLPGASALPSFPGLLAGLSAAETAVGAANAKLAAYGANWIPALTKEATEAAAAALPPRVQEAQVQAQTQAAKPYIGPQPKIITRKGWGADESIREKGFVYTKTIKAAFVHHSATGNNYTCAQAPSVLRGIYRYHVKSSGWRDFGYNFAVDKCGNIYEGRAGGVAKPVLGAHTLGFNTNTMGIAVLGSYGTTAPPAAAVTAVARLTAWKLGLHGINPKGTVTLVSGGGNLYKKGTSVRFHAIAGHRDGFATECPGAKLYGKLGTARTSSASYQGRS
ncbi:N-acetylmuramoyl-L-alanine amidase [Streptomyces sp. NPDC001744]|uniref:peptidoglycan recognition protein family protein n=1 Tax=Streptomyces sp. NPDC001744 TaxID=3364606 RepID=UPI0036A328A7